MSLITFLLLVIISTLKGQFTSDSCYDFVVIQEQYFAATTNSFEDSKQYVRDKRNLKEIYSKENFNKIVKTLKALSNEIACENTDKISVVFFHQGHHSLDYLYVTVSHENENRYFFIHPYEEKIKFLGTNSEGDDISYVFHELYKLDTYFTNDYAIILKIVDNRIVEQLATQKFDFHVHFQILASVANLISCDN